jgi:DNA mismatch repair protein MutS2
MTVGAGQLTRIDPANRKAPPLVEGGPMPAGLAGSVVTSLDLHGKTVEEAIAVLDAFVSDALLGGAAEVRIIHGRSGGKLKAAVHGRLRAITAVRSFRVDPQNEGVTIAVF